MSSKRESSPLENDRPAPENRTFDGLPTDTSYPPFFAKHGLYLSQDIIGDKHHPVLTLKARKGSRVTAKDFAWKRGRLDDFGTKGEDNDKNQSRK